MEGSSNKKAKKNSKNVENKTENLKSKKRQREDENIEDTLADPDKNLSKSFNKMDFSDESEGYLSKSDSEEEVYIDDDHADDSDDYAEEEVDTVNNLNKMETEADVTGNNKKKVAVWEEGKKLEEGMELDYENEAYDMLHRAQVEWPCMSLDFVLADNTSANNSNGLGENINNIYNNYKTLLKASEKLDKYPYNCYLVAGSQTTSQNGYIYAMKWQNMRRTKYDDDPEKAPDSDEEDTLDPFLKFERVQIKGNINRIRSMKNSNFCALWSDSPAVEIVDIKQLFQDLDSNKKESGFKKRKLNDKNVVLKSFPRSQEGFGINWANHLPGVLAAGGQDKKIEIYYPVDENCSDWTLSSSYKYNYKNVLKAHKGSIEDIAWSPIQAHVLGSCSTDKSIRFWDLRNENSNSTITIENAHTSDVNCISWNNFSEFLVASGGDDGAFKVWDIRYINNGPITNIQWHKGPITSLQWDNFEDSQIAVSSEDNRLSIWDFAVEPDDNQLFDYNNKEIPQQLVFLHQGQENIKDIKMHPVFKNFVASTSESGINVFKPGFDDDSSIGSDEEGMDYD